jgi:hypothetical protein
VSIRFERIPSRFMAQACRNSTEPSAPFKQVAQVLRNRPGPELHIHHWQEGRATGARASVAALLVVREISLLRAPSPTSPRLAHTAARAFGLNNESAYCLRYAPPAPINRRGRPCEAALSFGALARQTPATVSLMFVSAVPIPVAAVPVSEAEWQRPTNG